VEVLTDNGQFPVTSKYRELIETLFQYYIFSNKLPKTEYNLKRVNRLLGNNISEDAKVFEEGDIDSLLR
jgi:hypothetical protein